MTHAHILGPPRSGRKVNSVDQVLEELRQFQESRKDVPANLDVSANGLPDPSPSEDSSYGIGKIEEYFIETGRFAVDSIQEDGGAFIFHELKLPMGYWDQLALTKRLQQLPIDRTLPPDQWKYQDMKLPLAQWISNHGGFGGLPPVDIVYGLATVCYLNRNRLVLADKIKEILCEDAKIHQPFTSTCVDYMDNANDIIRGGFDWADGHPFRHTCQAKLKGPSKVVDENSVRDDPYLAHAVYALLGESDYKRFKAVMEWVRGADSTVLIRSNNSCLRGVTLGFDQPFHAALNADLRCGTPRPARYVMVVPSDYKKE